MWRLLRALCRTDRIATLGLRKDLRFCFVLQNTCKAAKSLGTEFTVLKEAMVGEERRSVY